jgi:hypothetical protein
MNSKQTAIEIRKRLKAKGWGPKQISVTSSRSSSVRVEIKDLTIDPDYVDGLTNDLERVSRCERTGEILSGGNLFISVSLDYFSIEKARETDLYREVSEAVNRTISEIEKDGTGKNVFPSVSIFKERHYFQIHQWDNPHRYSGKTFNRHELVRALYLARLRNQI